jgi:heme exporter protein CcmD
MDHAGFIIAAFALTGLVVAGLIGAIVADHARLKRSLERLGLTERS